MKCELAENEDRQHASQLSSKDFFERSANSQRKVAANRLPSVASLMQVKHNTFRAVNLPTLSSQGRCFSSPPNGVSVFSSAEAAPSASERHFCPTHEGLDSSEFCIGKESRVDSLLQA